MDSLISLVSPVSVDPVGARAHAARSTREGAVLCGLGDGAAGPSRREFASWVAGTGCPDDERFERVVRYARMRAITDAPGGGPVSDRRTTTTGPTWLSMGEASALLGVSSATLRRWAVEGRLATFTTPGGHRRFSPAAVESLLPRRPAAHAALAGATSTDQIQRAYRQSFHDDAAPPTFLDGVPSGARESLRGNGRVITTSIMRSVEARTDDLREAALAEGMIAAAAYGRIAGTLGATMRETVAAFLRFRMPFVREVAAAARRMGLDVPGATDLLDAVTVAIDRLLDATLEGFETASVREPQPIHRGRPKR